MLALAKELDGFNEACIVGPSEPDEPGQPDLIVAQVDFVVSDPGQLRRSITVKNVGTAAFDVQSAIVQGFYSADTILDGNDAAAGGRVLSTSPLVLAPGASVTVNTGGGVPGEGHLYLLQIVDYGDTIVESDETNNLAAVLLPDL
jgi:subtilase family serine protease